MNPGTPPPAGAAPPAPASLVTCPSCRNPLQVDLSLGVEGPCPICGYYLRLVAPPHAAAAAVAVAAPAPATGEPIKPAPRHIPATAQRRELPAAREPVFTPSRGQRTGRRRRRRHLARLLSQFLASPGGKMTCAAIIVLGLIVIIFIGFRWDTRQRAANLEMLHPSPPAASSPEAGAPRKGFHVDDKELRIPSVR